MDKHKRDIRGNIEDYLEYYDMKDITKESYRRILIEFAKYTERLPKPPTRNDVKKYRDRLFKMSLKPRTVQKYIVVIRNFYAWVYAEGRGDNLAIGIKGARIENDFTKEPLSIDESKRLIQYASIQSSKGILEFRNYVLISLMITTGLRTIEITKALIKDIHYVEDAYTLYIQGKGRDGKDDYVKLSKKVYSLIMQYLSLRSDEHEPLFINHGRRNKDIGISTRTISKMVKEYLRDIGIDSEKYTAHSLRHTAATLAMLKGASIHSTQHLLRHKSPNTTQIYVRKVNRRQENYEQEVSDTVFEDLE